MPAKPLSSRAEPAVFAGAVEGSAFASSVGNVVSEEELTCHEDSLGFYLDCFGATSSRGFTTCRDLPLIIRGRISRIEFRSTQFRHSARRRLRRRNSRG